MSTNTSLQEAWDEARTRFSNQLSQLNDADLKKKIATNSNSIGFLIRHIGDIELLFAKNVFGDTNVSVRAKTIFDQKDSGEWNNLNELLLYVENSYDALKAIISQQSEVNWGEIIVTKEFGSKTKAEALGRIISHTSHHAGQLALIKKYGS
jgi:uncharacterized damage-inducible protein DinB